MARSAARRAFLRENPARLLAFVALALAARDVAGLLALLAEINLSLTDILKSAGITSGFLFVVLVAGITAFLTLLLSFVGSLIHTDKEKSDSPQGITGMIGGAITILTGILLVFM